MAEWRAHTLDRLRALRPARVLEIGCGTGLLLFGLLDGCDRYVGTDFSPVCLAQLRDQLAALDAPARAKVTLLERTADDLAGVDAGSFDVVVLNSVVQYFPGPAYLGRVLEAALAAVAPGGAVFLGDLRHHGLLAAFHVSVQLHRAADLLPIDELHARVSRSLENERELLVDPAYLTEFAAAHPEVGAVELLPKRGVRDTELTRYRYDAVLRLGGQRPGSPQPGPAAATTYDWSRDVLSRSEIEWLLDNAGSDSVEVTGVPNARVAADAEAARLLTHPAGPQAAGIGTAGDLRLAAGKAAAGMDPEELYRLGEGRGWSVAVSWATRHAGGSINALFRRGPDSATAGDLHAAGPEPDLFDVDAGAGGPLTNTPLRTAVAGELERHARQALRQDLPEYAGACQVVVLDELPRTADGRVDEAALPAVEGTRDATAQAASGRIPPRTAGELRLARIWERALRVRAVDVRTSFFDLGGDSLLAIRVVDEATRVFGRDVPLAVLLQEPTIEGMAAALRTAPGPWTPLVEITPGAGTPFFCVHPAGGSVLCYAELARSIDTAPLYALQARGLDRDEPPYDDLSAMAARYLQDVRATQPSGPYLLGGWSFGGLVAYEMAQQLADAGDEVGLLALIDTPTPDLIEHVPDEAAILARMLDGVVTLDPDQLRAMPAPDRLRHVLTEAERARAIPPGMDPELARQLFGVFSANLEAAQRYRPRPYGGRTCLLRAAQSELTAGENRWAGLLTGPWELIEVPGNHETILWPPNVQQLASALQSQFAAALIAWRSRP